MKLIESFKNNYREIALLPVGAKIVLTFLIAALALVAAVSGFNWFAAEIGFRRLQNENRTLEKTARAAEEKARKAEENAGVENLRARNLEARLKEQNEISRIQDNEIEKQSQTTSALRVARRRARVSQPKSVGADELERRLDARYGQPENR